MISWGKLHEFHATYFGLLAWANETEKILISNIPGMLQGNVEVQQHWYAHWVSRHAKSFKPADRGDAAQKLAAVCVAIRKGKLRPWGPYPQDWYVRLLGKNAQDPNAEIGDNFAKLGGNKLEAMLRDPVITAQVLPPLSREDFEKM